MLFYKDFKLIQPNESQKKKIESIILNNNGSVFHEVNLNEIVANQFKTKLYYLVNDEENIHTLSPVHIEKIKFSQTRYHFKPLYDIPYAGFVGKESFNNKLLSKGLFDSIIYQGFPYKEKTNEIISYGETSMVDLRNDEDFIFNNSIHSKRRNMIRKAIKEGVEVKCYVDECGLKEFWPILEETHNKLGYHYLTFDYYLKIVQEYKKKDQINIHIAYKEKTPISGIIVIGNLNYMHYYKGASLNNVTNYGQGELLQWEAIKLSKNKGVKYYDLCNLNKDLLPSIYKFKTGISKKLYEYPIYSNNSVGFKVINRMKKLL